MSQKSVPRRDVLMPTLVPYTTLFRSPVRYYVPQTDVRMDLLTPTDTETGCPYKGFAHYWTVDTGAGTHEDVAWSYRSPFQDRKSTRLNSSHLVLSYAVFCSNKKNSVK